MPLSSVLTKTQTIFEQSIQAYALYFEQLAQSTNNCRIRECPQCKRIFQEKQTHAKRVKLLRSYIDTLTPRDTPSFLIEAYPWNNHGIWQGYITDDGYYVHGRDGDTGFFGHDWLHNEYEKVRGTQRRESLIKVHSQAISWIIFFGEKSLPTQEQLLTIRDLILSSDEVIGIRFEYHLRHTDPDIPF